MLGGRLADVGATRNRCCPFGEPRAAWRLAASAAAASSRLPTTPPPRLPPRCPRRSARRTLSVPPWQPLWLRLRRVICPTIMALRAKRTARRRSSMQCAPWWRRCEGILPRSGPSSGPTRRPCTSRRGPRLHRRTPLFPPCPACDHVFRKLICTWPRRRRRARIAAASCQRRQAYHEGWGGLLNDPDYARAASDSFDLAGRH